MVCTTHGSELRQKWAGARRKSRRIDCKIWWYKVSRIWISISIFQCWSPGFRLVKLLIILSRFQWTFKFYCCSCGVCCNSICEDMFIYRKMWVWKWLLWSFDVMCHVDSDSRGARMSLWCGMYPEVSSGEQRWDFCVEFMKSKNSPFCRRDCVFKHPPKPAKSVSVLASDISDDFWSNRHLTSHPTTWTRHERKRRQVKRFRSLNLLHVDIVSDHFIHCLCFFCHVLFLILRSVNLLLKSPTRPIPHTSLRNATFITAIWESVICRSRHMDRFASPMWRGNVHLDVSVMTSIRTRSGRLLSKRATGHKVFRSFLLTALWTWWYWFESGISKG